MTTVMTEVSRKQTCSREKVTVTRVMDVTPYSAWYAVANSLLGGVRLVGGYLYRIPPAADPYIPWAFCQEVDVEGVGKFQGSISTDPTTQLATRGYYDRARLTIRYETWDAQTASEVNNAGGDEGGGVTEAKEMDLATQTIDISNRTITVPTELYKWRYSKSLSMSTSIVNAYRIFPQAETTIVRHLVITRPLNAIMRLIGTINYSSFRIGTATWPSETVRFEGAHISQKITNLGIKYYEIQYKFLINPVYDYYATTTETLNPADPAIVTAPSTCVQGYVGWNRQYRAERGYRDRLVSYDTQDLDLTREQFEYDTTVSQSLANGTVSGFNLLFHPGAI